jgi:hypothetical protein
MMRPLFALAALSFLFPLACGSTADPGPDGGTGGDGKYHPPGNGQPMTELDACNALNGAQDADHTALGCVSTTRSCPELIRVQFGTECQQYDQGSVQGCVDYYAKATTCADLNTAINDCVVTPIEGSAPAGCP